MAAGDRHLKGNIAFNTNLAPEPGALAADEGSSRYAAPIDHVHAAFAVQRSQFFDLDNGAGVTVDELLLVAPVDLVILDARIIYDGATTGTVAAGNAKIGTTAGGAEVVAATAYEDGVAVGSDTAMTLVEETVPAGTPIFVRHTGVAATQAGTAAVQIAWVPA
jgi:hypothetical protein